MANPELASVSYLNPWGTLPPGHAKPGVEAIVSNPGQAPGGSGLIARLLEGAAPVAYGGGTAQAVWLEPPAPLGAGALYSLQVQWAPLGTNPATASWTGSGVVAAPVLGAVARVVSGMVEKGQVSVSWAVESPAATPPWVSVSVLDVAAGAFVGEALAEGTPAVVKCTLDPAKAYRVYVLPAASIEPPATRYSWGSPSPPLPLPVAAPAPTGVSCDGATLSVAWPKLAPPPGQVSYALVVTSNGNVVGAYPAGPEGGAARVDFDALASPVAVGGRVSYGPFDGPLSAVTTPLATAPQIAAVSLQPSSRADSGGRADGAAAGGTTEVDATVSLEEPPPALAGAALEVDLLEDGAVKASGTATGTPPSLEFANVALGAGRCTVRAGATIAAKSPAPARIGPLGEEVTVVPGPVAGVAVSYDGSALSVAWDALPDPRLSGYSVALIGLGQSSFTTGVEPRISIPAALSPGDRVTATVTPLAGVASGLPGATTTFAVPSPAAPTLLGAWGEPGQATISWSPSTGGWVDGYVVTLTPVGEEERVVLAYAGMTASATVRLPRPSLGRAWTVTVAATAGGVAGPPSATATLAPTTAPDGVAAVYDGAALHVRWAPVADDGVSGYTVTVKGSTPAVEPVYVAGAASGEAEIPVVLTGAFPGATSVIVQASAKVGATAGPNGPSGAAATPTLAGSVRTVTAAASGKLPYLARYGAFSTLADAQTADVVAYLASPFASGAPTVTDGGTPVTFTLAPLDAGASFPGGPAYQLTIAKSVWSELGSAAVRPALRAAYRAFLVRVEEGGTAAGGVALVRQAIATAMPQTPAETLYYRYGVWRDATLRAVDLDPGLRLRLAGAAYQVPLGVEASAVNGFVALGGEQYDLAAIFPTGGEEAGMAPSLTVDAFLASLLPGGGEAAGTTVLAGSSDFFGPGARQAYYRLFYPKQLPPSGATGSADAASNVTLVGAPSWKALESATDTCVRNGAPPLGGKLFVAYFRGRAMLTPLAAVAIGGETRWVPVGTTVRQLLAAAGAPVAEPGAGARVALARQVPGVLDSPRGGASLRSEPVDLSGAALGSLAPQLWPLDLPLLGGDEVVVGPEGP